MPYIYFSEEQKLRANSVDLVEFLKRQGERLIPSGRDRRLASDHSITVRGNEWYDHASEEGGGAISFVQNFYGLTYPEAVTRLRSSVQLPSHRLQRPPVCVRSAGRSALLHHPAPRYVVDAQLCRPLRGR